MTPSRRPFGASPARVELRPRTTEIPLGREHPDDAFAAGDDYRWGLNEEEQRLDRVDDMADRPWPSAAVVALPARDDAQKAAA